MRQYGDQFTGGHRRQHGRALHLVAQHGNRFGGDHGAGQKRFQHQSFAHGRHHQHGIDWVAAEAAVRFRHVQRQQAEVGEPLPDFRAESMRRFFLDPAPGFKGIILRDETPRGFLQHLLFFAEREIHELCSYSPRIIWAMIFF